MNITCKDHPFPKPWLPIFNNIPFIIFQTQCLRNKKPSSRITSTKICLQSTCNPLSPKFSKIFILLFSSKTQGTTSWYSLALTVVARLVRWCRSCATVSNVGAPKLGKSSAMRCAILSSDSLRKGGPFETTKEPLETRFFFFWRSGNRNHTYHGNPQPSFLGIMSHILRA